MISSIVTMPAQRRRGLDRGKGLPGVRAYIRQANFRHEEEVASAASDRRGKLDVQIACRDFERVGHGREAGCHYRSAPEGCWAADRISSIRNRREARTALDGGHISSPKKSTRRQ